MRNICICVASMLLCVLSVSAQTYKSGDTGTFGGFETYNYNGVMMTLNATNDYYAIGFTAFEDLTIDRVKTRLVGIDSGTTIRVGVMADDGSGFPDGTYMAGSGVSNPTVGNPIEYYDFGSVSLPAGSVYHVVFTPEVLGVGESFMVYGYKASYAHRVYDRQIDSHLHGSVCNEGGAWAANPYNGFFVLGNGSDVAISGPSQPYMGQNTSLSSSLGGGGGSIGQRFTIFDTEVPAGASVLISNITFVASKSANVTNDLLVELREDDLNVLATASLPNADIDFTSRTVTWDSPVWLQQGTPYLVTFGFLGERPSSSDYIYLQNNLATGAADSDATWGGASNCVPIKSPAGGVWSSYSILGGRIDIRIQFTGLVYKAPKGTLILVK